MNTPLNDSGSSQDDSTPKALGHEADNLHLLQTACTCGKSFALSGLAQQHATLMNGVVLERERQRLERVNDLVATDGEVK